MKEFSGKFVLRLTQDLHKTISDYANNNGLSLNKACIDLIQKGLSKDNTKDELYLFLEPIIAKIKEHFGKDLVGIMLFGSYATNESTEASDIDLLIVLSNDIPIVRKLYRWWDNEISETNLEIINPHFVNLPKDIKKVTGLWLEVAEKGKVLYQRNQLIEKTISKIKKLTQDGMVRKYVSNGHPFWVWRQDEK